ncbi:MAG: glutamate mutase L [Anaerolineae bacterium]
MSDEKPVGSVVAADIGSAMTHACLLESVEGTYRLVASAESASTAGTDVALGLRRSLRQLESAAGRPLLDQQEDLIVPEQEGQGVDLFVATSSAAPPLQCIIVGLTNDLSIASAKRACAAANVRVVKTIALGARLRRWDDETVNALLQTPPDVLLLVGGADGSPTGATENAAHVLAILFEDYEAEQRPVLVYAGNQEARRAVSDVLAPLFDVRVVDNVRPNVYVENLGELQREMVALYENSKLARLPGIGQLTSWCCLPIISTYRALDNALRYIARRHQLPRGLLSLDVGGSGTHVAAACGDTYQWAIGAGLGVSHEIGQVLQRAGVERVRRWLPHETTAEEVVGHVENVRLRPHTIPQSMEDLLLEHAIVREAGHMTLRDLSGRYWQTEGETAPPLTPGFDIICARGGALAHTPRDGLVALTLLDALQPVGLSRLVVDWASTLPQLGALATVAPLAAAQALQRDAFRDLGPVIAPAGHARPGDKCLRLKIIRADGRTTEIDLPAGSVYVYPLPAHERAAVEVRPSRRFDIGLGKPGAAARTEVRGGSLGIIVDTRGRPLDLPADPQERQAKQREWLGKLVSDVDWSP